MHDIEGLDRNEVYDWYRKFYNPANALIVISGDVIPLEALGLVNKFYGKIKGQKIMEVSVSEPAQKGERRFELRKDVMTPAFAVSFRTVQMEHEDACVLDVIARILSRGSSSRFERILVREKGIAASASVYSSLSKYGGEFTCFAIPQPGADIIDLERVVIAELERLKIEDVTEAELNKAKNQVLAQAVFRQDSPSGIAYNLGSWEIEGGGWQNINRYPEAVQGVTGEDIRIAANKYFVSDNRTIGHLMPESPEEEK
jgi:predicted Zn-dependent peptidase